jgi:erythronate-4-phosphate dehydrogenase
MQRNRFRRSSAVSEVKPLIVVDAGIPDVRPRFEGLGRVLGLPADEIDRIALRDADAVVVRSITRVDASLLEGTKVRFVGTATSGVDHVDRAWLRRQGIRLAHARGANAESVVDYVITALLRLCARRGEPLAGRTVGIVGCGNVGGRLARRLSHLGTEVLLRDPPKERRARAAGRSVPYVSMEAILERSDIVTLHTPLTRHGRDATHHLVDEAFLEALRPGAWLVNTARGPVVDQAALLARPAGPGALVLDVWEDEPEPDPVLVSRADIATAHIAGYALDSKLEATRRIARALARHLGRALPSDSPAAEPPIPVGAPAARREDADWLDALTRLLYPIERDDLDLRRVVAAPEAERARGFEALRKGYPGRGLFRRHAVAAGEVPPHLREAVFRGLGLGPLPD